MDLLAAMDFSSILETTINILWVALGLGLVIFFHELGHFAVAKWCDVQVDRFSLGFGPVLCSFKRGETEYALSAIPFGGYVKMLGQDDMDPSQLSNEEIAEDPRSYSAKTVRQRMAIISAGVIMNIITGMIFFALAFRQGVEQIPSIVGSTRAESPSWKARMQLGYDIQRINDRKIKTFGDIMRGVALTSGDLEVAGMQDDGRTPFEVELTPDMQTRRIIGVGFIHGLDLVVPREEERLPTWPGTSAAKAKTAVLGGDRLERVGDERIENYPQLQKLLAARRGEELDFYFHRKGDPDSAEPVKVAIAPTNFRSLGLKTDIGKITAIQIGSPADKKLKVGDRISEVSDDDGETFARIGHEIDPFQLPGWLGDRHGKSIKLKVLRPLPAGDPAEKVVTLEPEDYPGWIERPESPGIPLTAPAIGIAFHVNTTVLEVVDGGPAAKAKIKQGERIKAIKLSLRKKAETDGFADKTIEIQATEKKDDVLTNNFAYAFWMLQRVPTRKVQLEVVGAKNKSRTVDITPTDDENWFVPDTRGLWFDGKTIVRRADNTIEAIGMGMTHTQNSIIDIYLTLRNLFAGMLSPKELHGPVGIAKVAYAVARQGSAELLLFLGFLSINLAVLNFLPIPVLDGGHMVFLCWEAVTRKKPSERVLIIAQNVGLAFVLGLMIFVLWLDLFIHK